MARFARLYRTSIGAKSVMAITGGMLFLFLIGHLGGNLLVFKGRDALNSYAQGLKNLGPGLWVIRLGLLAVFLAHVGTALRLVRENRMARPVRYQREATLKASLGSRYMMLTGMVVLAFVVYHIAHLTLHQFGPRGEMIETMADGTTRSDVYGMVVTGFSNGPIVTIYMISLALLLVHLLHGIASVFQTLGLKHETINPLISKGLPALAVLIVLGKMWIALSIFFGGAGA